MSKINNLLAQLLLNKFFKYEKKTKTKIAAEIQATIYDYNIY